MVDYALPVTSLTLRRGWLTCLRIAAVTILTPRRGCNLVLITGTGLPIWRRSAAKIWGLIAIIGYRSDAAPQLATVFTDCGYHSDAALRLTNVYANCRGYRSGAARRLQLGLITGTGLQFYRRAAADKCVCGLRRLPI